MSFSATVMDSMFFPFFFAIAMRSFFFVIFNRWFVIWRPFHCFPYYKDDSMVFRRSNVHFFWKSLKFSPRALLRDLSKIVEENLEFSVENSRKIRMFLNVKSFNGKSMSFFVFFQFLFGFYLTFHDFSRLQPACAHCLLHFFSIFVLFHLNFCCQLNFSSRHQPKMNFNRKLCNAQQIIRVKPNWKFNKMLENRSSKSKSNPKWMC